MRPLVDVIAPEHVTQKLGLRTSIATATAQGHIDFLRRVILTPAKTGNELCFSKIYYDIAIVG